MELLNNVELATWNLPTGDPPTIATVRAALSAHGLRPEFMYRHRWKVGDVLIWDDCSTIHRATFDYPPEARRLMHRCVVSGE